MTEQHSSAPTIPWITDPDAIATIARLNGFEVGDQVLVLRHTSLRAANQERDIVYTRVGDPNLYARVIGSHTLAWRRVPKELEPDENFLWSDYDPRAYT